MAIIPSPTVNFGPYGNTGTLDISKFSRTGSAYTNTDTFQVFLQQNMQNDFDILFGDEQTNANASVLGENSIFNSSPNSNSPFYGGNISNSSYPSDLAGLTNSSGVSPALEMIARANLIGKNVDAIDPTTRKTFSGKVQSVSVEGGIILINVDGVSVPPENLLKVTG